MTTLLELTKKLHNTLALYNGAGHALGWKTEKVDKLLDESKRVIELAEQPAQQEPVAWLVCENWRKHSLFFTEEGAEDFKNAAQREDDLTGNLARWKAKPLYTSPPAQQEPVAWTDLLKKADEIVRGKTVWKRFIDGTPLANDIAVWMADFVQQHTSPPASKPWVGLTDEQIAEIATSDPLAWANLNTVENRQYFARAIEAKLKEKNT